MQVLYDPLQAYFPLLKQWIGTMVQKNKVKKQLNINCYIDIASISKEK